MNPKDRDFEIDPAGNRKAICRRCKYVIIDYEPSSCLGEFYHPLVDKDKKLIKCSNAGKTFENDSWEMEPFVRKRIRRLEKRLNKRKY